MRKRWQTGVALVMLAGALFFVAVVAQDTKPIDQDIVASAEKIIGLEFTTAERDSLLDDANDNLEAYHKLRSVQIANSVPPALHFNPVPVGAQFGRTARPIVLSPATNAVVPDDLDNVGAHHQDLVPD